MTLRAAALTIVNLRPPHRQRGHYRGHYHWVGCHLRSVDHPPTPKILPAKARLHCAPVRCFGHGVGKCLFRQPLRPMPMTAGNLSWQVSSAVRSQTIRTKKFLPTAGDDQETFRPAMFCRRTCYHIRRDGVYAACSLALRAFAVLRKSASRARLGAGLDHGQVGPPQSMVQSSCVLIVSGSASLR